METIRDLSFKEIVDCAEYIKGQYIARCLLPFFNEEKVREYRYYVFNSNIEYWKREKIWEYLNGDFDLTELKGLIK